MFTKSPEDMGIFQRMLSENFGRYRRQYTIAIVCLLIGSAIQAFAAWLMGPIVDLVFYGKNMHAGFYLSGLVVFIFLVRGGLTYVQSVILARIGYNLIARYQRRLFDHLMDLDVAYFSKQHTVELVSRMNQNIASVSTMLNMVVLSYARDLVTLLALIGVMLYRDPVISVCMFTLGPLAFFVVNSYAKRVKRIARQEVELTAQVATGMQEAAHGIAVVKAFTMEDQLRQKLVALTKQAEERSNKIARLGARTSPLMEFVVGLAMAAVIAYGGWRVAMHNYAVGDLTSFMTALMMAYEPAKRLARMRVTLERSFTNARMIYEILDEPTPQKSIGQDKELSVSSAEVQFSDVNFQYDEVELNASDSSQSVPAPVIDNLSFTAKAGKTTALVGPSGGGKSTIISLIQRFYLPQSGAITIDGQNINEVTAQSLRENIAYVSQAPILFQGTVRENLRFARPDASDSDIEEAARHAQAHDFITALPDGYDTELGENGTNLSGGQRQRLSIARALVRNAPILLLDEATSALDNESEALVQKALEELMQGRTTIVVAHRLSTIANADKIIVIDRGKLVDEGTPAQLSKRKEGVYARLNSVIGDD